MIRAYDDHGNVVDMVEHDKQVRADVIEHIQKYVRLHTKYADKTNESYVLSHDLYDWLNKLKEK